ncbi:polyprenol reductase 2-like [Chenopodium quinoa]|uniref:3-oxo-5-alpha-steroid 4-dehydrogenase C-terminal domain-containing protein n=1 Tax=Chenopodium quinoa TaxID=63459 RepID=A0A803LPG7_CHEQI|nr:polyprenol reductase 2-like [Chenopodium quinoa]
MELEIERLLRMAWLAWILPILIVSFPSSHLNSLHHILLVCAGRGKICNSSSRLNKLTVPQKFFSHFYVFAVIWTSFLLLATWEYAHKIGSLVSEATSHSTVASYLTGGSHIFSIYKTQSTSLEHNYRIWRSVFLLILMEFQVLRRLYESLYVFNYSSTAQMHICGYLTGFFFYTAAPLSLCCNCAPEVFTFVANRVAEFIVKGKEHMPPVEFQWLEFLSPLLKLGWFQWIGAVIFFCGWLHQCRCHAILGNLREVKEQDNDYRIPHGDWFEVASSPHYLAEIVMYAGLVVASGGLDLTVWLMFAFVMANLVFAAAETHRWYKRKFDNYPSNRYAIIPFLY